MSYAYYSETPSIGRQETSREYMIDGSSTSLGNYSQGISEPIYQKRPNILYFSRTEAERAAQKTVKLAPIRLDIEFNGIKIRDQFTWNINEEVITPEIFGRLLIEDLGEQPTVQLIDLIADEIRKQIEHCSFVSDEDLCIENETDDVNIESNGVDAGINGVNEDGFTTTNVSIDPDASTLIKLDFNVGSLYLKDQFEWPLFSKSEVTPEKFSLQLTAELGAGAKFSVIIAHSIREQLVLARMSSSGTSSYPNMRGKFFRLDNLEIWQPELKELSEENLDKIFKEKERKSRLLRRQIRHMSRNIIPKKRHGQKLYN